MTHELDDNHQMTYARVWFLSWCLFYVVGEFHFPFQLLFATVVAHLSTKSLPWLIAKLSNPLVAIRLGNYD